MSWNDLPEELLETIASNLDVIRFDSVCKSWRRFCCIPPFHQAKIPTPLSSLKFTGHHTHTVSESIFYRLKPSRPNSKSWMVRLDKDEASNRMQASIIQTSQTPPPKLISLSELGISKIFTTYITRGNSVILKLVFNFSSESVRIPTTNNYAAVAITLSRKLAVWKSIDEEGTELERVHYISDIIYYKRKF